LFKTCFSEHDDVAFIVGQAFIRRVLSRLFSYWQKITLLVIL